MKIMMVVTHLLGTGHLSRSLVLGRAFAMAGHHVTLVSGGMPAPHLDLSGVEFRQLPALRSDGVQFTKLLDDTGAAASENLLQERKDMLQAVLHQTRPDVVITELFPFGRRVLAAEFTALLEAAKATTPRPVICASVRDILAPPSKPAKVQATETLLHRFYDAVLVHSDQAVTPLDISWPVSPAVQEKLRYTGFVAPPACGRHPDGLGAGEIIVTAGGGNVGAALFDCCLAAAAATPARQWRLLVGGVSAQETIAALRRKAGPNVILTPVTPDFRQMLYEAAASVSLCGYNTALDILQAGTPAVFVPFDAGGEVEQSLRAEALSKMPAIGVVRSSELSAGTLLSALETVMKAPRNNRQIHGLNGAENTVRVVETLAGAARHET